MKIIVSQQGKNLLVTFEQGKTADSYFIAKTEDFLVCVDKFVKKRKVRITSPIRHVEFENTGLLTERAIMATIGGLRF